MLKMAVLAPMPIASDSRATAVTPGLFRNERTANLISRPRLCMARIVARERRDCAGHKSQRECDSCLFVLVLASRQRLGANSCSCGLGFPVACCLLPVAWGFYITVTISFGLSLDGAFVVDIGVSAPVVGSMLYVVSLPIDEI